MPRKKGSFERRDSLIEMEREFEEKVDAQRRQSTSRSRLNPRHEKNKTGAKPPVLLRVLAWCGVILLCFVAGYIGTGHMLDWLGKPLFSNPHEEGTAHSAFPPMDDVKLDMQKITLSLFFPKDGVMAEERADVIVSTREDNVQEAVAKLLELSGLFDETVYVKHVFRNVDTIYLDFSSPFTSALSAAGARLSTLFITGLVRTMQDNFPPVTKVRFLVESKIDSAGAPVDLTVPWQLR
jgi:hypothetical protein